jgi:hypothetical protein
MSQLRAPREVEAADVTPEENRATAIDLRSLAPVTLAVTPVTTSLFSAEGAAAAVD